MTNSCEYALFTYFLAGAEGTEGGEGPQQEEGSTAKKVLPDVVVKGGNRWWEEEVTLETVQELMRTKLTPAERKGSKKRRPRVSLIL